MKVTNKTKVDLMIMGVPLKEDETRNCPERCFDALVVTSEIGECIIKTDCKQRTIEISGSLRAEETEANEFGLTNILIYQQ